MRAPRRPEEQARRDVDDEVRFHLEERERALRAGGMSAEAARAQARAEFGDIEKARDRLVSAVEDVMEQRVRRQWRDEFGQDLRFGWRKLRSSPGFTTVAVLTLALGMGATAAIFSVVNSVLLRPLAYESPDALMMVWENDRVSGTVREPASVPDFYDFRERNRVFSAMGFFQAVDRNLTRPDLDPQYVSTAAVSSGVLPLLGVAPRLGRVFEEAEDQPGAPHVAILSESFWRSEFGGDAGVIGREILLDDSAHIVVGVMPAEFEFPNADVRVWTPARLGPTSLPRYTHPITVIARLRPDVTIPAAQQEMTRIASDLESEFPTANAGRGVFVEPVLDVMFSASRPALLVLLVGVGLLLLIACANVASLVLARGLGRSREVAVRAALGAGRGRIARQFVVESLMLALFAAGMGIIFARLSLSGLVALLPADLPRTDLVRIDSTVLGLAALVAAFVGVVFGLVPALQTRRLDVQSVLKSEGDRSSSTGRSRQILRAGLVVAEVAISVVLVIGAALLVRTVRALRSVDPGFRAENVLRMEFQLPDSRYPRDYSVYPNWPRTQQFYSTLLDRVRAIPGVVNVTLASHHPLAPGFTNSFVIAGRESEVGTQPEIVVRGVSAGYAETLGLPLIDGRSITEADRPGAPPVVVINEAAARRFFPQGDAMGARLTWWGATREVVGIVGNQHFYGLTADVPPAAYVALPQAPMNTGSLLVRANVDPRRLAGPIRDAVREADPQLAVFDVSTLEETVLHSISRERSTMLLLATFAAVALVLALVGVHSVLAYAVSQRTRELGVRVALGAASRDVLALVLRQGLALTLAGIAIGLIAAFAGTRVLGSLLWGVSATDPATFTVVTLLILLVATIACWIPARRAARLDPVRSLRSE